MGDLTQGLQAFERAARLEPRNGAIQLQIGKLWQAKGDVNQALKAYQQAVTLKPELADAQAAIGDIYMQQQDFLSAIIVYRQLVRIDPTNPQAHYKLAQALQKRDRTTESIESFERARQLYQQQGKSDQATKVDRVIQELKKR